MSNKKISELEERAVLKCNCTESAAIEYESDQDSDLNSTYLMLARKNIKNQKISFPKLKSSTLDSSFLKTGVQICRGEKTFSNDSLLHSNVFVEKMYTKALQDNIDETVCFKYKTNINQNNFTIDFPKTFKHKPVLSISTQCSSGSIIPYSIYNITKHKFSIKFATNITDYDFAINITAYSPSYIEGIGFTNLDNQGSTQSFSKELLSGSKDFIIQYPNEYQSTPTITTSLEGPGDIIPYTVKNITSQYLNILFATELAENYFIHTISHE